MASRWATWWELNETQLLEVERDGESLVLWHRTPAAATILASGFRDAPQRATTEDGDDNSFAGVFLSNRPLDSNEGAKGDELLRVVLPATESELDAYELKDEEGTYREWCVPAELLNMRGTATLWNDGADSKEKRDG